MGKLKLLVVLFCVACASSDQAPTAIPTIELPPPTDASVPAGPAAPQIEKAGIQWYEMNAGAFLKAEHENKPIMMYLHDETCEACIVMERATLNDPDVAKRLNSDFMPVMVPDRMRQEVEKAMGQLILPSIVFLRPNGDHLLTIQGFVPPSKFKFILDAIYTAVEHEPSPADTVYL